MRKFTVLFVVIALLVLNSNVFAQWQTHSNGIYYNDGYVGIGDPDDLVFPFVISKSIPDVTGNNQQISKCNLGYILNSDDTKDGQGSLLRFRVGGSSTGFDAAIGAIGTGNNRGRFSLFVDDFAVSGQNNWNEAFSINYDGNIGINIQTPTEKLEVNGKIKSSGSNSAMILCSPDGTEWEITVDNSGNLSVNESTKVDKIKTNYGVNIYPNPTKDFIDISISSEDIKSIDVELYNLQGKLLYMRNFESNNARLNLKDFAKGLYMLKIKDENGFVIQTEKVIKQ